MGPEYTVDNEGFVVPMEFEYRGHEYEIAGRPDSFLVARKYKEGEGSGKANFLLLRTCIGSLAEAHFIGQHNIDWKIKKESEPPLPETAEKYYTENRYTGD